jgi:hypothetical protein
VRLNEAIGAVEAAGAPARAAEALELARVLASANSYGNSRSAFL